MCKPYLIPQCLYFCHVYNCDWGISIYVIQCLDKSSIMSQGIHKILKDWQTAGLITIQKAWNHFLSQCWWNLRKLTFGSRERKFIWQRAPALGAPTSPLQKTVLLTAAPQHMPHRIIKVRKDQDHLLHQLPGFYYQLNLKFHCSSIQTLEWCWMPTSPLTLQLTRYKGGSHINSFLFEGPQQDRVWPFPVGGTAGFHETRLRVVFPSCVPGWCLSSP